MFYYAIFIENVKFIIYNQIKKTPNLKEGK